MNERSMDTTYTTPASQLLEFAWQQAMDDTAECTELERTFEARVLKLLGSSDIAGMASQALFNRWNELNNRVGVLCAFIVEESVGKTTVPTDSQT